MAAVVALICTYRAWTGRDVTSERFYSLCNFIQKKVNKQLTARSLLTDCVQCPVSSFGCLNFRNKGGNSSQLINQKCVNGIVSKNYILCDQQQQYYSFFSRFWRDAEGESGSRSGKQPVCQTVSTFLEGECVNFVRAFLISPLTSTSYPELFFGFHGPY